ncbi:MAG TPA: YihY/virulence factor BrkB family protein [Solirubrobacterales bacterium]
MESATQPHPGERSGRAAGSAPSGPLRMRARSWVQVLKRTAKEFQEDQLTDLAAGLTYYAVLAIFPALIALVSILGLVGSSATDPLIENVEALAPGPAQEILVGAIEQISSTQAAGIGLVLGLLGALWSASGYVGGFARASNRIYEVAEGRPFWKLRPLQIGITVVMVLLLAVCALAVIVTGPLAREVGDVVGAGDTAVTIWDVAKWPAIVLAVITMMSVLFWTAPNVKQPGFRWITPGGVVAVVLWLVASLLFAFYVANFGAYNATYGSIAAVIVFLVWLWITNLAILFGAELNAELERERELAAGVPEEETIALEPRDPKN